MNETIGIGALAESLVGTFGKTGGRNLLLQNLRSGALSCTCDEFYSLNPSAYSMATYPDSAVNFALPPDFWSWDWSHDGEVIILPLGLLDPLSLVADWAGGNFSFSGSYRRGHVLQVRRAMGVKMDRAQAFGFMKLNNVSPSQSTVPTRATDDQLADLCDVYLGQGLNSETAFTIFKKSPLREGIKRAVFRAAFAKQKALVG